MSIFALIVVISYLLGSIPAGYLVGRLRKIDIRHHGSGNIGATNVVRVLGKAYGYPVFLFDFLKGFAAVEISFWLTHERVLPLNSAVSAILAGICCVLGHSYPFWLGFKGGKGVATSLGVLFGLDPLLSMLALVIWLATFAVVRVVSVASILSAVALPMVNLALSFVRGISNQPLFLLTLAVAAVVVWRHRSNIARLRRGEEHRFDRK